MTEIQPYQPPTDPTGGRLVSWAAAASAANSLAKSLCKTEFIPKEFQGKEFEATAAILMGDELGMSPLVALKSIYVVHGTPALYARTMVGLAQAHGHEIWTKETSDTKVTVCGQRRGSSHVEESSWTVARARQAGYTNNRKYTSNPQEMLFAKASAEIARKVAADVLAGIPYSVEDLELEQPAETVTLQRGEPRRTTARRAVQAVPAPEPELDGDGPVEGPLEPTQEELDAMTAEQS